MLLSDRSESAATIILATTAPRTPARADHLPNLLFCFKVSLIYHFDFTALSTFVKKYYVDNNNNLEMNKRPFLKSFTSVNPPSSAPPIKIRSLFTSR